MDYRVISNTYTNLILSFVPNRPIISTRDYRMDTFSAVFIVSQVAHTIFRIRQLMC